MKKIVLILLFSFFISNLVYLYSQVPTSIRTRMNLALPQKGEEDNPSTQINGHEHSSVFGDTPDPSWTSGTEKFKEPPRIKWEVKVPGQMTEETSDKTPDLNGVDFSSAGNPSLPPATPRQPGVYVIGNSATRAMDVTKKEKDANGNEKEVTKPSQVNAYSTQKVYVMDRTPPMVEVEVKDEGINMADIVPAGRENDFEIPDYQLTMKENPRNGTTGNKKVEVEVK